jgi:transcriptional regulator with XRE-family HTH domain
VGTTIRIRVGLLRRLRETRGIPSEEYLARLVGVDRSTLRRVDNGAQPSGAFMAGLCDAFGLGLGEAFEVVSQRALNQEIEPRS